MADQGNPPRPGDPVPNEGLDPTQVFGSPPQPPQSGGGAQPQDGAAKGDQAQPPKDNSPPPPPPGTQATAEMGFDEEDIKILGEIGDYRFGSISDALTNENISIPSHPDTTFDDENFLSLLRGSISLTRDEKWRIIQAIPKLSQFQVDELQKILEEERQKFSQLSPKHLKHLMQLEKKHAEDWKDLQSVFVQDEARAKEQDQADEIRKQLGL